MNAVSTDSAAAAAATADEPHGVPQLRTILLTDLVDSTALVERLGDGAAAELFRAHDRLVLRLQHDWRGRLIDRSDGLLLLFERPVDGLGFALDYFRGLRELGAPHGADIKARAGLHVGEVLSWRNSDEAVRVGAKPVEVEGLAKPMAGRLMTMARPGQLLMSAVAEPLAHRAARELGERGQHLLWKSHGRWRFKGVPEPQQVFEVGEPGITPLRAPQPSPKAWRDIPLWRRPAALATELVLLAALGFGIWFVTRPQPAIAFNERDWVVLADLRNLTDQPLLDDSLEQAFRISLEQSRHVNVLSDLKTRDTLARMQRAPDTELDRAIASEIAIRDGARAVILPTVAEVGGRVRVSAEVIDPNSQTTVYAEYADGKGAVSALDSIDEVTAALREKLGEALEAVEQDSEPLPQVTTGNLDALRAYALGSEAYGRRAYSEALQFFNQAVEIDPQFALAYMGIMRVHIGSGDKRTAQGYLEKAVALREHLTARDALYLDAWAATFRDGSHSAASKWKLLSELYPDYFAGHANYAAALFFDNRFREAMPYAQAAAVPQNSLRAFAINLIGRLQLAQGEYPDALESFRSAEEIDNGKPSRQSVAALAAMRRFKEARVVLDQLSSGGTAGSDLINQLERIALAVEQAEWAEASAAARKSAVRAQQEGPLLANVFGVLKLTVDSLHGARPPELAEFREQAENAIADASNEFSVDRNDQAYIALAAIYLAQRSGDSALAEELLPRVSPIVEELRDPISEQMLVMVKAGQKRLSGDPLAAIEMLEAQITGHAPFQLHVALRDAYRAAGRMDEALRENRWIAEHRGLAYIEPAGGQVLQSLNVADSSSAHKKRGAKSL